MGKSRLTRKQKEQKNNVVMMPQKEGGKDADAAENGGEQDAPTKPGKGKATETIEKEDHKGSKKALRHAVKKVVKDHKDKIAEKLVERTEGGDMHCAAVVLSLIEKKKTDGEGDNWDGPGLADLLVPDEPWGERATAKRTENEEDEKTEAA